VPTLTLFEPLCLCACGVHQIEPPKGLGADGGGALDVLQDAVLLEVTLMLTLTACAAWATAQLALWVSGTPNVSTLTNWGSVALLMAGLQLL
jgi:hypothetical protein